jgi:hypothetical protein
VSLPVVNSGGRGGGSAGSVIRASKNWPKRVIVLTLVHVFIIAHIIHWVVAGRTTTTTRAIACSFMFPLLNCISPPIININSGL